MTLINHVSLLYDRVIDVGLDSSINFVTKSTFRSSKTIHTIDSKDAQSYEMDL
jgi:hypothetical protein